MITSHPLITELSRSLPNAFPEPGDNDLTVPNDMQPVVNLMFPIDRFQNAPPTTVQTQSRIFALPFSNTNAGGGSFTAFTLSRGLWRISVHVNGAANYPNTGGGTCMSVLIDDPSSGGSSNYLGGIVAAGAAGAEVESNFSAEYEFLLPKDGCRLLYSIQANGVGENNHGILIINAIRLA